MTREWNEVFVLGQQAHGRPPSRTCIQVGHVRSFLFPLALFSSLRSLVIRHKPVLLPHRDDLVPSVTSSPARFLKSRV